MFFAHECSEHLGSFAVGVIGKCAPCDMLKQCLYAPALVQRAASFKGAHLGCFLGVGSLVPLLTKNSDDLRCDGRDRDGMDDVAVSVVLFPEVVVDDAPLLFRFFNLLCQCLEGSSQASAIALQNL